MNIEYVAAENLRPGWWRATYVMKPELKLMRQGLKEAGWLSPIIANAPTRAIIDGHARWQIAMDNPKSLVPVTWMDCDEIDAAIWHLRLNRARGEEIPRDVSSTIRRIARSKKYEPRELRMILGMTKDEFSILWDGTLLKVRKIPEHQYSRAWVPVETAGMREAPEIKIERPPTPDR